MSSNYTAALPSLHNIEGGYCRGGEACGGPASGETYKGIDRKQQPQWSGWPLIDAYKKQNGGIPHRGFVKGNAGELIEQQVIKFYEQYWKTAGLNLIINQQLANLLYAYIVHRGFTGGMRAVNAAAIKLGAAQTYSSKIHPQVALALEKDVSKGYDTVRAAIIAAYRAMPKTGKVDPETFVKTRVFVFPEAIEPEPEKKNFSWLPSWLRWR